MIRSEYIQVQKTLNLIRIIMLRKSLQQRELGDSKSNYVIQRRVRMWRRALREDEQ
jgi:hypothetical protein